MKRQFILLLIIFTICFTGCKHLNFETKNEEPQKNNYKIDTSLIAILPFDSTQHCIFKDNKPTDLTNADLQKIEIILNECIEDYNPEQEREFKEIKDKYPDYKPDKKHFVIDLALYKRQYIATLNSKGEKEVWVNCFCDTWDTDWKKHLVFVLDGGNCFFQSKN